MNGTGLDRRARTVSLDRSMERTMPMLMSRSTSSSPEEE